MPVTILDMIVIGVVLISALLAALRGFTREVLAIGSWAAAAFAAYAFHPQAIPLVQQYVSPTRRCTSRSRLAASSWSRCWSPTSSPRSCRT